MTIAADVPISVSVSISIFVSNSVSNWEKEVVVAGVIKGVDGVEVKMTRVG